MCMFDVCMSASFTLFISSTSAIYTKLWQISAPYRRKNLKNFFRLPLPVVIQHLSPENKTFSRPCERKSGWQWGCSANWRSCPSWGLDTRAPRPLPPQPSRISISSTRPPLLGNRNWFPRPSMVEDTQSPCSLVVVSALSAWDTSETFLSKSNLSRIWFRLK